MRDDSRMELDEEDRRAHASGRRGSGLFGLTYVVFGLLFAALVAVAVFGGTTDAVRAMLVEAGLLKREDFSALYAKLGVAPLSVETEAANAASLGKLAREPCDPRAVKTLADTVAKAHEDRWAADALVGWAKECGPASTGELRRATSLYLDLYDYARADKLAADLLAAHPTVSDYWYLRGKAQAGLGDTNDALLSYANTIHLSPQPDHVGRWVFQEMSDIYAASLRYCEAIGPIMDYMSLDLARRSTPQMQEIIDGYASKGHCSAFASGAESFPTGGSNVIRTRASVNGVVGTFVVDTGASFVTVTKAFAGKAHLAPADGGSIRAMTANGSIYATLASAQSVKVGRVDAKEVPVAIQDGDLGDIDGLLGRSFLSRFDLTISSNRWTLRPKSLAAAGR